MEDVQIIELYFARDEHAIKETDAKYGKLCFQVAHNLLQNEEDSKECVNDTYLIVWNKIPPTHPNNLKAFLCKITRNLSLKKWESATAQKRSSGATLTLSEIETILPDHSIDSAIDAEELGRKISDFLREEKPLARNIFLRKYWFFDSISDIIKRYTLNENRVKSILFRTRNRLRTFLQKEGFPV